MRKTLFLVAAVAMFAGLTGCQGPEKKLARGVDNTLELIRWGDMRQSVEQNAIFSSPDVTYTYGAIHGFDQSMKRVGLGLLEIVTFPIPTPTYDPILTNYVPISPQYPTSYRPGIVSSSTFDTDTYTGFSGGDVAPFVPGSRFQIFEGY
jgi:putative exosortase-associated protein (TIGR04073 family)